VNQTYMLQCWKGISPWPEGWCFHGAGSPHAHARPGDHARRAGESPAIMVLPMAVLAAGALAVGLAGSPWLHHPLFHLLGGTEPHEGLDVPLLIWSTLGAGVGIWLAWAVGLKRQRLLPAALRPIGARCYAWAVNKYYVDEAYERCVIAPFLAAARGLSRFDLRVIDGAVNGTGAAGWSVGQWKERFDRLVVDRLVNALAQAVRGCGAALRLVQTGIVQQYLLVVVVSVVMLSLALR